MGNANGSAGANATETSHPALVSSSSSSSLLSLSPTNSSNDSSEVTIAGSLNGIDRTTSPNNQTSASISIQALTNWLFGAPSLATETLSSEQIAYLHSIGRPLPSVHPKTPISCPFNLNRNSLQMVQVGTEDKFKYRIQFNFDCTEPCTVQIFTRFNEDEQRLSEANEERKPASVLFDADFEHVYIQSSDEYLQLADWTEEQLSENAQTRYFPIAIAIEAIPIPSPTEQIPRVTSQITYANIIRCADDTFVIKPVKQKVKFDGKKYIMFDIFGMENNDSNECVICMTDERDVAVLPCRHMCLCRACADRLKNQSNKCPICRSFIRSMVQVTPREDDDKTRKEISSDSEEELQLTKKLRKGKMEVSDSDEPPPKDSTETEKESSSLPRSSNGQELTEITLHVVVED